MSTCIVILSFNHPEITARTIRSAQAFNLPIILVHNGSLIRHQERLENQFPEINHLIMNSNKGFSGGVNFGLNYAYEKFEWVIFLTNDTELIELSELPVEPALIAPLIYFRKLPRIDSMGGTFTAHTGKLRHIKNNNYQYRFNEKFYVPGTAFILHKEIYKRVNGFDESLHTYWEDVDFSMKVHLSDSLIYFDPKIKVLHRVGKTCHDNPYYTTYLYQRNRKKISWKYCNLFLSPIFLIIMFGNFFKQLTKFIHTKDQSRFILYIKAIRE